MGKQMTPLEVVQSEVSDHMDKIKAVFKSGVKITVLVRTPGRPTRDFMMTDDDNTELIAMIERRALADKAS